MRILHVVGIMNAGGIETWLMNVYRNIDRTKIQFDFVVHTNKRGYYDDEIMHLGGELLRVPKFKIINIKKYKKSWEEIFAKNEYSIIHTHIRSIAPIYLKIAKKHSVKTISHAHSTSNGRFPVSIIKDYFQHKIARFSDVRLACSSKAGGWLYKNCSFEIVKNAIDTSLYKFNNEIRNFYRKKFNIHNNEVVVGHIGRFVFQKNHDFILDIFSELYKTNNLCKLVLIGDGELSKNINKKIKKLNIVDNVIRLGVRSDIPQILQMFDFFIFPSFCEGLGIVLIEAQAAGLQCFISDTIPDEVNITNLIHRISLKKSSKFWANYILINTNKDHKRIDYYQSVNDAGFDINNVAKELENIYAAIIC